MSTPSPSELELEIQQQLNSEDLAVRKKAIFTAGGKKINSTIPTLIQILKEDTDTVARNSAARAMGKIADPNQLDLILEALIGALDDENYYVKLNAAWSLGKLKDKRAVSGLATLVDPSQRIYTFVGDGKTDGLTTENEANTKLKEEGMKFSDVIIEAIKAIGKIKDPSGIPPLIKALDDEADGSVRCAAALALGKIGKGDESVVEALLKILHTDKYWYVRRDIIKALGKLKDPRAVDELAKKTNDMYDEVKEEAFKALVSIGKPALSTIFQLYLKHPKNTVLKNYIKDHASKAELRGVLEDLIAKEPNPTKKKTYQQYLEQF
ncbi:MAG: HEAT repeat domain-containing protein [Promethearchaeota archaeon]